MILREEMFEQTKGLGLLELRGGDLEVALFLNGEPLIYDAADCKGSVGRFTFLLPSEQRLSAAQLKIEYAAEQGFEDKASLCEQITPLLQLLPNGSYKVALVETESCWNVDWDGVEKRDVSAWYYPPGDNYERVKWLIPTQPESVLDEARTNFYLREIEQGTPPALIIVGSAMHDAWFVLDGHHKLMASWCCGVMPRALLIEFQALTTIPFSQASIILAQTFPQTKLYLQQKARQEGFLFKIALWPKTR